MRGLGVFREYFAGYEDYYVLIGGTACMVLMEDPNIIKYESAAFE